LNQAHDEPGILRSYNTITKLITDEIAAGIPSSRIVLGGFSQGGALSLFTGVTTPHKLAGVFGLSSYLLMGDKIKELAAEAKGINKETPIFMGHGDADALVKYEWGMKTAEFLRTELGHTKVDFRTYK
jgi:predicted esterase